MPAAVPGEAARAAEAVAREGVVLVAVRRADLGVVALVARAAAIRDHQDLGEARAQSRLAREAQLVPAIAAGTRSPLATAEQVGVVATIGKQAAAAVAIARKDAAAIAAGSAATTRGALAAGSTTHRRRSSRQVQKGCRGTLLSR